MFKEKTVPLHYDSKELGVSFDLPARLTAEMDTRYVAAEERGRLAVKAMDLPFMGGLAYGIVAGAALESGMIQNWRCASMPAVPTDESQIDLAVVYYLAPIILAYREQQLNLPKASFWRRVMLQLVKPRLHSN